MGHGEVIGIASKRSAKLDGWCILRTNGRRTLRLAMSLSEAGIEAWTPMHVVNRRLSRIHMGKVQKVEQPMMPSFVFARAIYIPEILLVLSLPTNPHPLFSIFLHDGRAPVIADREIERLRAGEEQAKPRARRRCVPIGTKVRPTEGAFAGLVGVVEGVRGKEATVYFGGTMRFKISSWMLVEDQVNAA